VLSAVKTHFETPWHHFILKYYLFCPKQLLIRRHQDMLQKASSPQSLSAPTWLKACASAEPPSLLAPGTEARSTSSS